MTEIELHLKTPTVSMEDATLVTDAFWGEADPKPITPYNQVRGLVRRCLEANYQTEEIVNALHHTDAYTLSAIEFTLRSARKNTRTHLAGTTERILLMQRDEPRTRRTHALPVMSSAPRMFMGSVKRRRLAPTAKLHPGLHMGRILRYN